MFNYAAKRCLKFNIAFDACLTEPEIAVHGYTDKISNQTLKCLDILKYGQTLLQCMQI